MHWPGYTRHWNQQDFPSARRVWVQEAFATILSISPSAPAVLFATLPVFNSGVVHELACFVSFVMSR